jgi:hypothetical protein
VKQYDYYYLQDALTESPSTVNAVRTGKCSLATLVATHGGAGEVVRRATSATTITATVRCTRSAESPGGE